MRQSRICQTCGKEFIAIIREKTGNLGKFCSHSCYVASIRTKLSPILLHELYIVQNLSCRQTALKLGLQQHNGSEVVRKALKEYDIPVRSAGKAISVRMHNYPFKINPRLLEAHPMWKGGKINRKGYTAIMRPDHPRANKSGYVAGHVLAWEEAHGKYLPDGYVIHHLNGIPSDNRPENLVALPDKKHKHVLKAKGDRIRSLEQRVTQLEAEVVLLRVSLEKNQGIFYLEEYHGK